MDVEGYERRSWPPTKLVMRFGAQPVMRCDMSHEAVHDLNGKDSEMSNTQWMSLTNCVFKAPNCD